MDDVVSRYYRRQATQDEIEAAIREAPSEDLTPPGGIFLMAQSEGAALGCVGLRFLPGRIGELTRLYVIPAARRRGLGLRLVNELQTIAAQRGLVTMRLDTRDDLREARRLYASLGYREVDPFNDGSYADHWLQKDLKP